MTTRQEHSRHSGEDNLALEISENKRLLRLGLDPDGDPIQLMLAVERLAEQFRKEYR